jgi:hypothetical protein
MDSKESMRIRGLAASYAKHFLTQKYKQEYDELYNAYLKNRGVVTRKFRKPLIDERITSE